MSIWPMFNFLKSIPASLFKILLQGCVHIVPFQKVSLYGMWVRLWPSFSTRSLSKSCRGALSLSRGVVPYLLQMLTRTPLLIRSSDTSFTALMSAFNWMNFWTMAGSQVQMSVITMVSWCRYTPCAWPACLPHSSGPLSRPSAVGWSCGYPPVEVILGVVQAEALGRGVALPALSEDVVHHGGGGGCCCSWLVSPLLELLPTPFKTSI